MFLVTPTQVSDEGGVEEGGGGRNHLGITPA